MNNYTSEMGHWYGRDGSPQYRIFGANGKERNTTLRDSRKYGFLPSVTTILNIPAKPGLDRWKQNQILDAAWGMGHDLQKEEWGKAVVEKSSEIASNTASIGTAIHANIEQYYIDGTILSPEYETHVRNVEKFLKSYYPGGFIAERSFGHPLGYGGKVDLSVQSDEIPRGIVFDFKSKDFKEDTPIKKLCWPEQALQLDAYRNGLLMPEAQMISIYIDRTTGIVKTYEWEKGSYFEQFKCLLKYWQLSKGYDSSFEMGDHPDSFVKEGI